MQIFVHHTYRIIVINVSSLQKISSLKQRIFDIEGIPIDLQYLSYAGKQLDDNMTLESSHIDNNTNIQLAIKWNKKIEI